jgi:RNA polymerase sigma-70 factor (ECF subfamily)
MDDHEIEVFVSGLPQREKLNSLEFGRELKRVIAEAVVAWPNISIPTPLFLEHLRAHWEAREECMNYLQRVRASDLYLACGCAHGVENAVRGFDREFSSVIEAVYWRTSPAGVVLSEAKAAVMEHLLIGVEGSVPRIGSYSGVGPLGSWLRVVATRTFIEMRCRPARESPNQDVVERAADPGRNPEFSVIMAQDRGLIRRALLAAIGGLSHADRMLLRFEAKGTSPDAVAKKLSVSRRTIERRLQRVHGLVLTNFEKALRTSFGLEGSRLESLVVVLRSQMQSVLASVIRAVK